MDRHDQITLLDGLVQIQEQITSIFENDPFKDIQEQLDVLNLLFGHFRDLRDLTIQKKDKNARSQLVYTVGEIGSKAIEMDIEIISSESFEYLQNLLDVEVRESNDENAENVMIYLTINAIAAAKKSRQSEFKKMVSSTMDSMMKNGKDLIGSGFEYTPFEIARSLGEIIANTPNDSFNDEANRAIDYVKSILHILNSKNIENFNRIPHKHMIFEHQKTLGQLYHYIGLNEDAKSVLIEITEFEREDTDPDTSYFPRWYGEVWYVLSQVYHDLGDESREEFAKEEAKSRGYVLPLT